MTKRRYSKAEIARFKREERRMEADHDRWARLAELERKAAEPASYGQLAYIRNKRMHEYCGHDDAYLKTLTRRGAKGIIDKWEREVLGRTKTRSKKKKNRKKDPMQARGYGAWRSSDIKVTNVKTGEVRIEKNHKRRS